MCLKTLCNPDAIEILEAHSSTLTSLRMVNTEITDELIEAQSKCKKFECLTNKYYPLSTLLKNFQNLVFLCLDCQSNFSSGLLAKALSPDILPSLLFLTIKTETEEDKIFSAIPKAFPNLKSIAIQSSNQDSQMEVFRQFISQTQLRVFKFGF